MYSEPHELFLVATRYFYKKYKQDGGSQGKIAAKLGITNSYLSFIISGARKASLNLQNEIASRFYGPYDKYLAIGRQLKEGIEPLQEEKKEPFNSVEKVLAQLTHYVMDHQRIEKELKISQGKYRDISLTSGDMIFEMDQNFKFVKDDNLVGRIAHIKDITETGKRETD
jgi:transcriptional regulator with XRE-family HTH domain